jgi:hypothetical protein
VDPQFVAELDNARDYTALFRLVKRLVESRLRKSRGGIMLGLAPMGISPQGFLGGYFILGSNAMILNKDVLNYVRAHQPAHHNAYAFHVLLHEYLHTLGYFGEDEVRPLAHKLSEDALGAEHAATLIAAAMVPGMEGEAPAFFRKLVYPQFGWAPQQRPQIEIVKGFDPDATSYIG